jgi:hypothetical protein
MCTGVRREGRRGTRSFVRNLWSNSICGSHLPDENRQTNRIRLRVLRSRKRGEIGHLRRPPPVAGAEEVDEKSRWGDTVAGQTVGARWQELRWIAAVESGIGLETRYANATHLRRSDLGHSGLFSIPAQLGHVPRHRAQDTNGPTRLVLDLVRLSSRPQVDPF